MPDDTGVLIHVLQQQGMIKRQQRKMAVCTSAPLKRFFLSPKNISLFLEKKNKRERKKNIQRGS
jgi:hypothetical protein